METEKEKKDFIKENYMLLTVLLRTEITKVTEYLREEQIISKENAEHILSQAANSMKVQHLLDILDKLPVPENIRNYLYAASLFAKVWKAADVLEPEKRPHKADEDETGEPLPDEWPLKDHAEVMTGDNLELKLKVKTVEEKDKKMKDYYQDPTKFQVYEMKEKVKGRALIINNYKFTHHGNREGTKHDEEGLKVVLSQLGFEVIVARDQTAQEMAKLLDDECKRNHADFNCFILVILSHGDKGIVFGTDGMYEKDIEHGTTVPQNYIVIEDIQNQFIGVSSLEKKPKLLVIQACRGGRVTDEFSSTKNEASPLEQKTALPDNESDVFDNDVITVGVTDEFSSTKNEDSPLEQKTALPDNESDAFDNDVITGIRSPQESPEEQSEDATYHLIVALPNTEGNKSWRSLHAGSWFIQAFIYVLMKYAYKEHLITLLGKVNKLVRKAYTTVDEQTQQTATQVPEVTSSAIKKFYFFPGLE